MGAILAAIGLAIALSARPAAVEAGAQPAFDWRGWGGIIGGTVAFIVLGDYGGLVPATFAIVFISALGDRENTLKQAFCSALAMVVDRGGRVLVGIANAVAAVPLGVSHDRTHRLLGLWYGFGVAFSRTT